MHEAGRKQSHLEGALIWPCPTLCASLISWCGRPEIAEAVNVDEMVLLKGFAAHHPYLSHTLHHKGLLSGSNEIKQRADFTNYSPRHRALLELVANCIIYKYSVYLLVEELFIPTLLIQVWSCDLLWPVACEQKWYMSFLSRSFKNQHVVLHILFPSSDFVRTRPLST